MPKDIKKTDEFFYAIATILSAIKLKNEFFIKIGLSTLFIRGF
jgi:hypothetical protein